MKHEQYSYKGYDITIIEENKKFEVIIFKDGKYVNKWIYVETFMLAGAKAQQYIDDLQGE